MGGFFTSQVRSGFEKPDPLHSGGGFSKPSALFESKFFLFLLENRNVCCCFALDLTN